MKVVDTDVDLTNDAIYWRGLLVQRYAGIEFGITHLLVTASLHPDYADLGPPPFKLSSKLSSLRRIIEGGAHFAEDRSALTRHLRYFENMEESRHFAVHGAMLAKETEGESLCHFRLYQHRNGSVEQGVWTVPLKQFIGFVEEVRQHSVPFGEVTAKITRQMLAEIDGAGQPSSLGAE